VTDTALLVARLALALVFVVAGLAKLVDRSGSRQAVADFGVPAALAVPLGLLLPLAELAVAAALLPAVSAWWAAVGALALLLAFVAGIAVNLARGRKPDCHCFGQLHSSPVGWATLARNGALAVVAGFVVWQGREQAGPSVVSWLAGLSTDRLLALIGGIIVLALLLVQGLLIVNLLRQNGRLLVRLEAVEARLNDAAPAEQPAAVAPVEPGLPVGSPAPEFSLRGLRGETLTLDFLRAFDKPIMLLFADPGCGPCNALLPEVGRWQRDQAASLTMAMISRGTSEANRAKAAEHGLTHVLLQQHREVAQMYQADGTPSAVLVRPDGTVGSSVAAGTDAIRALVARTAGAPIPLPMAAPSPTAGSHTHNHNGRGGSGDGAGVPFRPVTLEIGQAAPALRLPDLKGKSVNLAGFRGRKTLILFWNPDCGYCQQMLEDLKAWEAKPPKDAPKLLVVSTGTAEQNRAMGLRSPVLLDPTFSAGHAFGANGTPSAVLVDTDGKIASELAVGAPAVLALAGAQQSSAARSIEPAAKTIGQPAPALKLPDLTGNMVDLAEFRGSDTLVLFWNLGCGFCQQMLEDLKAWEANPPKDAPNLLVVSTGTVEENRAMGLRSPVLLDPTPATGHAFGANGTPMAVLVDANGNIASEVAVGAQDVFALAHGQGQGLQQATP
jgi:peroxiredoxin